MNIGTCLERLRCADESHLEGAFGQAVKTLTSSHLRLVVVLLPYKTADLYGSLRMSSESGTFLDGSVHCISQAR